MYIADDDKVNVVKGKKWKFSNAILKMKIAYFAFKIFSLFDRKNSEFYFGFWKFEIRQNGGDLWPHKVKS